MIIHIRICHIRFFFNHRKELATFLINVIRQGVREVRNRIRDCKLRINMFAHGVMYHLVKVCIGTQTYYTRKHFCAENLKND